jgi:folate-binding protein YgfZ
MATQLPLHVFHERLGARFGEVDGHLIPLRYGDPAAEHEAVRERVGVSDRSHRGKVSATGRDRVPFLHAMLTNDIKTLAPGQGCPAAFLDAHGKVVSLLVVHCLPDRLILETDRILVEPTLTALDRFLFSERVEFEDVSAGEGILTLAGPSARKTVEEMLGQGIPDLAPYHHARVSGDGLDVRVVRAEETGEEGYDVWAPTDRLSGLWDRALAAGARPVGREAWNILRVEAGVVWCGVDVDTSTLIMEAPLERAYSLTKGCYLGQEVIARVTYRGHVNRRIVGLVFPDERIPASGSVIRGDGKEVGRITSAVVSPALRRGLALAFLRREHWEPGTKVEALDGTSSLTAEVTALPFYRRGPAGP